jgi:hypothetical protein
MVFAGLYPGRGQRVPAAARTRSRSCG